MPDRRLPDKAIDVLDEACSRVNIDPAFNGSSGSPSPEEVTTSVTDEVIARVIADWTKRPIEKIGAAEKARLSRMEEELRKRVIGQDDAVSRVAKAIKMSRAGLRDPKKTIGVFLFLGPTGVGKTELAKSLAEFLFDSDTAMIRFDMSEYMEKHSVSKFIGSPPGYVGHEDEGQLTGKLRRRPYSLVLLDEIEKAHPDVLDLFLQVFDEGRITDSKGREIDARNAIFIMTSNIGTNLRKAAAPGFGRSEEDAAEEKVSMELKKRLRPEFLNRIDEIIRFNSLDIEDIEKIARLMIEGLRSRAGSQGIDVYIADPVITYIARNGYDPAFGARPLSRLIDDEIGIPLSELIISKRFDPHGSVIIEMGNSGPTFEVVMKNI
ncbi:MAG: ATP-dependent Clp protease ATP-binding subunit ClpC [Syntrophus sp. PtaB.Bin138]|nr:MAG: ATP-dependent Clp protease ATP-binding subunit ClpC [Syntrophus sp. PtaB.Bin138]